MPMLSKLETKSNRVKGLSFHPTRPWILASLHNGIIQLWDYRIRTLLDRFDEHDGPVRGVSFHWSQPLFVSGGDDYKIKVWNYKQRRCLFTLLGHLDYIRTVEFHHEYPWILSASDDQTLRIWNWQSRTCIAVLTGHNHYVMCASFHPKEDLVVSASLDQTVRVWDISGLRKKTVYSSTSQHNRDHDDSLRLPQNELFGNTDAIVKYSLEGHERGVNWATFHPSNPLIVSGADDRQVKLWRYNESKAWEVDTFRGHFNNVSCCLFHPRQEILISNSEDKTIRVWDIQKRAGIQTFRREHDRFWILAAHPEQNLFAAGHDTGMIVFKLERERPAYSALSADTLFYVKDKYIRSAEYATGRDVPVLSIRTRSEGNVPAMTKIRSLSFSPQDKALLLCSDAEGGYYELYLSKDEKDSKESVSSESKRGLGITATFVGRKRFAVLDKSQQIIIKNLKNEETKRCASPFQVDAMYAAPNGLLLLKGEDKVALYDVQQRRVLHELNVTDIRYVFWSGDKEALVALVSKEAVTIANRRLEQLCVIHETIRLKSGAWDENGILIYSTLNHIKYCLPNGDSGIVRTLDTPLYITAVKGNKVYCLDREGKVRVISIDTTEYMFKHALVQRKYTVVLKMVREYNLIGQSIIAYLQRKGFPEVALHFVKDEKTRFNLALECGNIEVALESAKTLNEPESWNKLAVEALRQGNHQIVEMAYQRTKNFEKLSFLYLITGNTNNLKKMLKIAEQRQDVASRFHNALYLGDITERVRVLEEAGQISLAYLTAVNHGLPEAEKLRSILENSEKLQVPDASNNAKLMLPPHAILKGQETNWPLLTVSRGYFEGAILEEERPKLVSAALAEDIGGDEDAWGSDLEEEGSSKPKKSAQKEVEEEGEGDGGWPEDEIDMGELESIDVAPVKSGGKTGDKFVVLPQPGPSVAQVWSTSNLPVDHVAAGSFETAMQLLNSQVGIVNFAPLREKFLSIRAGASLQVPTLPSLGALGIPLYRDVSNGVKATLPMLSGISLEFLIEDKLKGGYKFFTNAKFAESLANFLNILHSLVFIVVDNREDAKKCKELLGIARDYIVGLRMEMSRKDASLGYDAVKQAELAAYFTHSNLEPIHLQLALRSAMNAFYKMKNYQHAGGFARRLLELDPKEEVATTARKVIKFAEQNNENAIQINYNERNPFVVCAISFTPIYRGSESVNCGYCGASYLPKYKGHLCPTCQLSEIGKTVTGWQLTYAKPEGTKKERRSDW
eukprot:TRINITY_DN8_c0_g4_i1.p1 TRINITY_DN8_c0_g4~~TRINITY_DN8_c0_g4_i1.p1  ORF type:complete len:1245 (-),score=439.76 TRINITY_DN8_c0_g4_i1:63-3797(-)